MKLSAFALAFALVTGVPAQAHDNGGTEVEFFGAAPCTVVCSYWIDNGFTPCEAPFPPGSYLDKLTSAAPEPPDGKVMVIGATLDTEIDWDGFLCSSDASRAELAQLFTTWESCSDMPGPGYLAIGCHEEGSAVVTAGQTVIFRAYNWSDAPPAVGRYAFLYV